MDQIVVRIERVGMAELQIVYKLVDRVEFGGVYMVDIRVK